MKDKYLNRKEEMGKLLEEEYDKKGKDIQADTIGFSMGRKSLKKASETPATKRNEK